MVIRDDPEIPFYLHSPEMVGPGNQKMYESVHSRIVYDKQEKKKKLQTTQMLISCGLDKHIVVHPIHTVGEILYSN